MVLIEASILAADYARLGDQACEAADAGVDGIQIDMMDGCYVPSITFGPGVVRALRPLVPVTLEADLMICNAERQIQELADAGADRLIVHFEACSNPQRVIGAVRALGAQAGIAISPGTPLSDIDHLLELVEVVQVMTVRPGRGGQTLVPSQLDVVRRLRAALDRKGLETPIIVDGGIDVDTARLAVEAGAEILVSGTGIFNERGTVAENVAALRASLG
jgi:ribulose-phosphate 3-epimerase